MRSSQDQLKRVLRRPDVLALAFGAMIGWGWVVLAGVWIQSAGSVGAVLGFLLGGSAMILIGLVYAELAAAMPLVGGEHVYSFRAFGVLASFVCTWAVTLGYVSVVAFEAVALPTVVEFLWPQYKQLHLWTVAGGDVYLTWLMVGVVGSLVMVMLNYFGIRIVSGFQKIVTLLILVVGGVFVLGAVVGGSGSNLQPLLVDWPGGLFSVLIMVPFLFVGFDVIPQAAEEIDLPFKSLGRVLVVSVFMAVAWYILIVIGVSLSLSSQQMQVSQLVTADAMTAAFRGEWAGKLLVVAGVAGIISSWNAFYVGGSRALYAMAKARMLPAFLGRLHPKYKTPTNAVLLIGSFSCLAPFFGRQSLVWLVNAGGLGIVVAYAFVCLSFLKLRKSEPTMPRPFRLPVGRAIGWVALVMSLGLLLLYLPMSPSALVWPYEWVILVGWSMLGLVLFSVAALRYGSQIMQTRMKEELSQVRRAKGEG